MNLALKVIDDICSGGKEPNRANILRYEKFAKKMPQIEIPVKHYIHGGMYAREITIPKGTILTGQIYKFNHFDLMINGDVTVSTDTGETKRLTGYNCFEGLAGKKRAGYAHEDTTWVTLHPYTGEDGEEIQKRITAETFEELNDFKVLMDRVDYQSFVKSLNMTEKEIKEQVKNKADLEFILNKESDIYVSKSKVSGSGLYSKNKIKRGESICAARIGNKRAEAGRYTNHAFQPNSKMEVSDNAVFLVAIIDIEANEEITVNYRDVINERNKKGDLLCQV